MEIAFCSPAPVQVDFGSSDHALGSSLFLQRCSASSLRWSIPLKKSVDQNMKRNITHLNTQMMAQAKRPKRNLAPTIENRIARMRYEFLDQYECGIELVGTEIKSVRTGKMNLRQGFARVKDGELFLHNVHISPWEQASSYFNHDPLRIRRLLLHKKYIRKLEGKQTDPGLTIVPIRAYFNKSGFLKIEVALARGKNLRDKREDIKRREDAKDIQRVIKSTLAA